MSSKTATTKSTDVCWDKISRLKGELDTADAVVIGGGAGLSASAGFVYSGERFEKYFGDFIREYGFRDMYTGGFYHFETLEEYWGYWSRYIYINRYMDAPKPVYSNLLRLVKDKDYFVLTTNVDHCFQKAGFDKNRLFYTQGDYGLWQCSVPCHQKTYDNEKEVRKMIRQQRDRKIPAGLVPRCPVCGAPMSMNLRADMTFVEDEGWREACGTLQRFSPETRGNAYPLSRTGRGRKYSGHHKISFLGNDLPEHKSLLCLYQSVGSALSGGDPGAEHLHRRRYRHRFGSAGSSGIKICHFSESGRIRI